jgi:hypothetical protein
MVRTPRQYVVRLRRDADKRIDLIAFGAASPSDVDALAERLGSRCASFELHGVDEFMYAHRPPAAGRGHQGLGDAWPPALHDTTDPMVSDQWGTANPNELVAKESYHEPDRGIFIPPPV